MGDGDLRDVTLVTPPDDRGAIAFAEQLLALLDGARVSTTYKFAVLLGLMDVCLADFRRDGHAPDSVTTRRLAEAVTALYWHQLAPFRPGDPTTVLRQTRTGQHAELLAPIARARATLAGGGAAPLGRVRARARREYDALVREVEWKLVEMPLPRLQTVGGREVRFIYAITWTTDIKRRVFNDPDAFDNQIRFVAGAGDHLVRLNGLLRPMLQRRWALEVSRYNPIAALDAQLEAHLFGVDRITLAPMKAPLRELQDGRCFYCQGRLREPQVDHFIPHARIPLDAIENLVLADATCNRNKCDALAASAHVDAWAARLRDRAADLRTIAAAADWESAPDHALGVARALYLPITPQALLWASIDTFVPPDKAALRGALA